MHLGELLRLSAQHLHQGLDFILVTKVREYLGHNSCVAQCRQGLGRPCPYGPFQFPDSLEEQLLLRPEGG